MTKAVSPHLLENVRAADSTAARVAALRLLKNDIIGHQLKKQAWIEQGVLPVLSAILLSRRGSGKRVELDSLKLPKDEEDEVCYQAITIIGSLALGGPAYTSPILAGRTVFSLLSVLSSPSCPRPLTLAILRTLNAIADQSALAYPNVDSQSQPLGAVLFSRRYVSVFCGILLLSDRLPGTQMCIDLVAELIFKTCTAEPQKVVLADSGVLDALGFRLATFVVAGGFVIPGAENSCADQGALGYIPEPAAPDAKLAPLLRAISVVIEHSAARADHLLTCPALVTVFPKAYSDPYLNEVRKGPWKATYSAGYSFTQRNNLNPIYSLLPTVPIQINGSSNFPPLSSQLQFDRRGQFFGPQPSCTDTPPNSEEPESVLISWLLYTARTPTAHVRLMAARLLAALLRVQAVKKNRAPMLGYLLVPLIVRMLDSTQNNTEESSSFYNYANSTHLRIKEEAPAVLASLITDRELQSYAVESGAIKKLAQLLKESFAPTPENNNPMWSASKRSTESLSRLPESDTTLGPPGFSPQALFKIRHREAILGALAAMALFTDDYRKSICDYGLVQYIIDSMKTWDPETTVLGNKTCIARLEGNPTPVVIAACAAARSLTRSVSVLRTSLIDAGVAVPVCALVKSSNIEIQIAATSVICNLALDFSPMKDAIIEANMLTILCANSHSPNASLRTESLWSLKHIAYSVSTKIKKDIFEDLGVSWIKNIICRGLDRSSSSRKKLDQSTGGVPPSLIEMGTANSFGEQVDILNPVTETNDVDTETAELDFEMAMADNPLLKSPLDGFTNESIRKRQLALNGDLDQSKKLQQEDHLAQEELFDLLRNIMCGSGAPDMIDYVLEKLGQGDFLDILADKLKPLPNQSSPPANTPSSQPASSPFKDSRMQMSTPQQQTPTYLPYGILRAVTYVLIHIAAGYSRHRHLVVFHQDLLKLIMNLLSHSDRQVRVNCVWVVINLTLDDDKTDRPSRTERAVRLKSLGVLERLGSLEMDNESDVRERTRTAIDGMKSLLGL